MAAAQGDARSERFQVLLDQEKEKCSRFLDSAINGEKRYQKMLQGIANRTEKIITINLDDVANNAEEYQLSQGEEKEDQQFVENIETNVLRYIKLFSEAIDAALPKPTIEIADADTIDVLMQSRVAVEENNAGNAPLLRDPMKGYPAELTRRYEIHINPRSSTKVLSVRTVGADQIGHLVTVAGVVTRITDILPLVRVATYTCDACGHEIYQVVSSKSFTPLIECSTESCQRSRTGEKLHLQTRGSKFLKYQQLTLQENPDQVPVGSIPRSMKVVLRGESTRQCNAGDKVTIAGIYLPQKITGFQAMKAGLTSSTYLECMSVKKEKKGYKLEDQSNDMIEEVKEMSEDPDRYSKLARSLAPEIFGHEDVKKALLLQLVSGVTKQMKDGMKIRGDVNILLMGDPGVAKSQLLKHVSVVAPRAIYTTGKGSSGVGLTAAVIKDQQTGDFVLEGGALVLSDMGICCIDEFDKMEEADRTAIHEVMEQQTVSIAKAGITTTLNARTAILAAANPIFGRYDKSKTPEENIVLPAALMSRFDLMFVLVDVPDRDDDIALARHILYVHQHRKHPALDFEPLSPAFIRAYIAKSRECEPVIPKELTQYIVGSYVQMRTEGRDSGAKNLLGTARTLLSILRLSQALARLRFSNVVDQKDVEEATRLMYVSKSSMVSDEEGDRNRQDVMSKIYSHIKEYMGTRDENEVDVADIENALVIKGFSNTQIRECFRRYEELDVWMLVAHQTKLRIVENNQ